MGYKAINGEQFKKMIALGGQNLRNNKALIDSLNVFPVPDGDTGTNMSLTFAQAVSEVNAVETNDLESIAKAWAKGALKGARGNSGVITSQIVKGMCEILCDCGDSFTTKDFAKALKRGTEIAYSAVTRPKEGTMLTVIRVIAENSTLVSKLHSNFEDFFAKLLSKGEEILAKTPDMLPVLKKAGTVDAGGKGLVEILRGFLCWAQGKEIVAIEDDLSAMEVESAFQLPDYANLEEIEFGYCTEFFVINLNEEATLADIDKLRDYLCTLGDSVLCIGDLSLVKVHVHTNNPGHALQAAIALGEVDKIKIENMREQNRQLIASRKDEHKELAIISICNGEGIKNIFNDLGVTNIIDGGQSMNPSVDDILNQINKANADNVIILPNNKNIVLAASQAVDLADCNVFIVPTHNILQGIRAAMMYSPEASAEENAEAMKEMYVETVCGEITYAIKNTNINDLEIHDGDLIGLDCNNILVKGNDLESVTISLLETLGIEEHDVVVMYYGNNLTEEDAAKTKQSILERYPDKEVMMIFGGQQHYFYLLSLE